MILTESKLRRIIREILQTADDYENRLRHVSGGARGEARRRKRVMYDAVIVRIADIVKQVEYMYPEINREALQDSIFGVIEDATYNSFE